MGSWVASLALALPLAAPAAPPLPTIPSGVFYVTNYGAVGDGFRTNTTAIQAAINAASTAGGGTVEITPAAGAYLSGPLTMKSSINLQVDSGAMLQMLPYASWPGTTTFINGSGLHDVEISGSGIIDGQGADWWAAYNSSGVSRPNFINFSSTTRILIQNVTLQNPPTFHLMLKGNNANITIQGITINTPGSSPNTDGMDLASTNILVQNCYISDGDDNIEIGGSAPCAYLTVTGCTFGTGHGVSVGSITSGGVSNVTVINCTFSGTQNGIRMKSDNASSGGGSGGLVQNLSFFNLGMTNVNIPFQIYSYYKEVGTPDKVSPTQAATQPVAPVTSNTVVWRNIIVSNLVATLGSDIGCIIWGRSELLVSNVLLSRLQITAPKTFDIYNAWGVIIADSQFNLASGSALTLYNAQVTVTNSSPGASALTLDGLTTNSTVNTLALYNAPATLSNTNLLGGSPFLTTGGSTLTVNNSLSLDSGSVLNFVLGTNADSIAATSDLGLSGTVNISAGAGFGGGTYTLLTYGGGLSWGAPVLGSVPSGNSYSWDTNTAGQVKLVVQAPAPPAPANVLAVASNSVVRLSWSAVGSATGYNVKRAPVSHGSYTVIGAGVTATNYNDVAVTNGITYYYVVSALNGTAESTNSTEVSATPSPSLTPVTVSLQPVIGGLRFSWPPDHTGWRLEAQTNGPGTGLGTNWGTVSGAAATNQIIVPIGSGNDSVFFRLRYP
jgi:hypothetical protein